MVPLFMITISPRWVIASDEGVIKTAFELKGMGGNLMRLVVRRSISITVMLSPPEFAT